MHHRGSKHARQIRILAGALGDSSPPRIACDVKHRRERPADSIGIGFMSGNTRGLLDEYGVPRRRLPERDRENRAVSVDHVAAEEKRNTKTAFFRRNPLRFDAVLGAARIEEGTPAPFANLCLDLPG